MNDSFDDKVRDLHGVGRVKAATVDDAFKRIGDSLGLGKTPPPQTPQETRHFPAVPGLKKGQR